MPPLAPPRALLWAVALLPALALTPAARAEDGVVDAPGPSQALAPVEATPTADAAPPEERRLRIVRVEIERADVFDEMPPADDSFGAGGRAFREIANALHPITREHVVRNQLLFEEGDALDPRILAETERNLRALAFIRSADVVAEPLPDGKSAIVRVRTADKWTLRGSAGIGTTGGVSGLSVNVGDSNIAGLGLSASFQHVERTDDSITRVSARDPNILGSRVTAGVFAAVADAGEILVFDVSRPFFERQTPWAAGASLALEDSELVYYSEGDESAYLPLESKRLSLQGGVGFGPYERVSRFILEANLSRNEYGAPTGPDPFAIRWPRNRDAAELLLHGVLDMRTQFKKLMQVDAFGIIEDIPVGAKIDVGAGPQWRDDVTGSRVESVVEASGLLSGALDRIAFSMGAEMRWRGDGGTQGLTGSGFARAFVGLPWQTLAMSLDGDYLREEEDADPQLTLGEDSGLRGYPARFFEGTRRLRFTVEDRLFTPFELLSFRFCAVVFFDAGLVWDEWTTPRMADVKKGVGFGLRFFSPELLKEMPFRIDVGFPLDDHGDGSGVSITVTSGQVFTLFAREEGFSSRF